MRQANSPGRRWLLPLTCQADLAAIEAALRLADSRNATLVVVSLLALSPEQDGHVVPFEMLQRSKDVLAAMRLRALHLDVPIETIEERTTEALASIARSIPALNCNGIILVARGKEALFLHEHEFQALLTNPPAAIVLIRFPPHDQEDLKRHPLHYLRSWWRNRRGKALLPNHRGQRERTASQG